MTQYNRYGWGNSDSPQNSEVLSPTRARGVREVSRLAWEALPDWARTVVTCAGFISVFGIVSFCVISIMLIWPDGGAQ